MAARHTLLVGAFLAASTSAFAQPQYSIYALGMTGNYWEVPLVWLDSITFDSGTGTMYVWSDEFIAGSIHIPLQVIDSMKVVPNPTTLPLPVNTIMGRVTDTTALGVTQMSNGITYYNAILERGICYSTSPMPTIADQRCGAWNQADGYHWMSGLTPNTTYYARGYLINSLGAWYGDEVMFTTNTLGMDMHQPGSGMIDADGNVYSSVVLPNGQEWITENLRTTHFNNGDTIQQVTNATLWIQNSLPQWCYYANDPVNAAQFGLLYSWPVVDDARGVCPAGWHVPTYADLSALRGYLDPTVSAEFWGLPNNQASSFIAGPLKATGTTVWQAPNADATNITGFSALPGGWRDGYFGGTGAFLYQGSAATWWARESFGTYSLYHAYYFSVDHLQGDAPIQDAFRRDGRSVRCLKD